MSPSSIFSMPSSPQLCVVTAVAGAFVIIWCIPQYSLVQSFTKIAAALLCFQLSLLAGYRVFIYPHFCSPFRYLPTPGGGHLIFGQWLKILSEPVGEPHREWINSISNNGIIRYRSRFSEEILMLTSPDALSELFSSQSYTFGRRPQLRSRLQATIGNSLIASEGDEHKVRVPC